MTNNTYEYGYWLPRLVIPGLVTFLILGGLLIERATSGKRGRKLRPAILAYSALLAGLYIYIL